MDIHQIMDILPHRPPFLLIDRIIELSDKHVIGMKNVKTKLFQSICYFLHSLNNSEEMNWLEIPAEILILEL